MKRIWGVLLLLFLTLCGGAAGSSSYKGGQDDLVIRVSSNLIQVPVSVKDAAGQPVRDLALEDFLLEEDGKVQSIAQVANADHTPLDLALMVDLTGSLRTRFELQRRTAGLFLREIIRAGDAVSVFSIAEHRAVALSRTEDVNSALRVLDSLECTQQMTPLYDSVVFVVRHLRGQSPPASRRALIVLSDGEDNWSEHYDLAGALREIQQADLVVYAINPSGNSIRLNRISVKGQANLMSLAAPTGGEAFLVDSETDLRAVFRRISVELGDQYLLSYYSKNHQMDGAFRRIVVRIPQRPELQVRARQGYYALRHG